MPIEPTHDLSGLNVNELYAVYLAIAGADHRWRIKALYGDAKPPAGHCEFRPLNIQQFAERFAAVGNLEGGERMFRQRLARQAAAYQVDVLGEVGRIRQAA